MTAAAPERLTGVRVPWPTSIRLAAGPPDWAVAGEPVAPRMPGTPCLSPVTAAILVAFVGWRREAPTVVRGGR